MKNSAPSVCLLAFMVGMIAGAMRTSAQDHIKPPTRRIVGGEKADISQHPWQVALDIMINGEPYLCGGSLIADRWVLTAAHCFTPSTTTQDVRAKAGAGNYKTTGTWLEIQSIIIHANYNAKTHENDIALIMLRTAPKGRVITLMPGDKALIPGQLLEVTGWGATKEDGEPSSELLIARVPYVTNDVCNEPAAYNGRIKSLMICAGRQEGGVDSCQGDSGGPLVLRSSDGPQLVGVVSWGDGCARQLKYGVYTQIAPYTKWIETQLSSANRTPPRQ